MGARHGRRSHALRGLPRPDPAFRLPLVRSTGQRERFATWGAALLALVSLGLSAGSSLDVYVVPRPWRGSLSCRFGRPFSSEVERWREMERNAQSWGVHRGRALSRHARPGESFVLGGPTDAHYCDLFVWYQSGVVTPEILRPENSHPGSAPGHDYRVNAEFFLDREPDITGCYLTPLELTGEGEAWPIWATPLRPGWREHDPLGPLPHEESFALPQDGRFPDESVAHIVRFHSWESRTSSHDP